MARYLVQWQIDIVDADTPREAAEKAFAIMQKPGTTANCFDVIEYDGDGDAITVDLSEDDWSCARCGETAMDGSGICITCGADENV